MITPINRLLVSCILMVPFVSLATASIEGPITDYFQDSDAIYLVRAEVVKGGGTDTSKEGIRFVVTEILRGQPIESLTLIPGIIDVKDGSEFLILSSDASRHGRRGNFVGSLFKGNVGWLDAPIIHQDGEIYVLGFKFEQDNSVVVYDKVIDGQQYLTLDHIKALLKQDAAKKNR